MSADDGADKTQPPKSAATFTSFINKNTSGKKFAPKAARRRPGAASQTVSDPTPAPAASPPTIAQLPTPAATQELAPATQELAPATQTLAPATQTLTPATQTLTPATQTLTPATQTLTPATQTLTPATQTLTPATQTLTPAVTRHAVAHTLPPAETSTAEPPPALAATHSPNAEPTPTPTSTTLEAQTQPAQARNAPQTQPSHIITPHPVTDHLDTARPAKRRRTDEQLDSHTTSPAQVPEVAAEGGEQEDATRLAVETDDTQQSRKRRNLPWVAVNHPPQDKQAQSTTAPAQNTREPPRARGRKKAIATIEVDEAEEEEGDEAGEQSTRKTPAARARNKRGTAAVDAEDNFEADVSAKKPRKPRKDKGKKKTVGDVVEDGAEGGIEQVIDAIEEGTTMRKPRKPRQPKRRKQSTVEGENAGQHGEENTQPKRRGRPPREDTPSDAEHQTIDPDATFMDSLASRNIRVGKLSTLERRMRDINWEEVRQRQREEDRRIIHTKETQAAVDKLLNAAGEEMEAANAEQGPRMRVVGDRIELIHDSGTIDREAEADMQIATMEVHEEADLTTRITTRSFMKNGKRFPNDFLLPGQGHRWSQEQTDRFYQGLRMYGTDFQMISMMFPNLSRRVIKTKFTREEREYPDKVAKCLLGELEMVSGWGEFLQASELQEDHFADADEIKRQMDEVETRMRIQIEAAKAETAERKRQLKEAGLLPEGEEGADGENGKGKKKRREKGKQVTFQEEEGVEILGGLDDDPNWGQ